MTDTSCGRTAHEGECCALRLSGNVLGEAIGADGTMVTLEYLAPWLHDAKTRAEFTERIEIDTPSIPVARNARALSSVFCLLSPVS
ncbi:MAG: hypothetical protein LBC37_03300 [Zoogloeaceae bacterium]|nr:hypothetical protein [Zoogloeaceae bacterium]